MIKNAKSLMDKSRNLAVSCNITVNEVLQNYMFERILERLSVSKYKNNFIKVINVIKRIEKIFL